MNTEFPPEKGHGKVRLNEAKKAISDFKKLTNDELRTADLMLYYVEKGVEFTNNYGDIDQSFYSSIESMYERVIILCDEEEEYYNFFANRLKQVDSIKRIL
ncbi:DUF6155 family protein [Bacillus sp. DJP31]|uniref:DUF6155 family protein n=1 Tax=Bacillus sp. DJP31 TaxID=3409789 RepID=UPI003BB7208D